VLSGTYSETFTLPAITGASATNTITFDGGTGNASTRIITYSVSASYGSVITLDGADYVKFKNLTIRSTNSSYGYCFLFTNSADYNEISNCVIETPTNTTSSYHIGIVASTTSSYSSTGDFGNYNLIKDNTITSGYYGIRWNGSGSSDYTTVTGNQFIGNMVTDWYYSGMYLYYMGGAMVCTKNTSIQRSTGTFTTTSGYAFYIYYPNNGPVITYNYGWCCYSPFYIYRMNNSYSSSTIRGKMINNMGIADGTSTVYGLYCSYPRYSDIAYNSIRTKNTYSAAYGIYQYGESSNYDVKFMNNMLSHEGDGQYYWIYNQYSACHSLFDYNIYYRTGYGTNNCLWNGTDYGTFAACKAAVSGFHQNSKIAYGKWTSATNLHSVSIAAYAAGTPVAGVADDYDGDTRSSTTPCIGADEFSLTNMAYSSMTCTQNNTNPAGAGLANQVIIGIQVNVTGALNAFSATSFSLNTTGTTSTADISSAKLYYTGFDPNFAPTNLFATVNNPSGSFVMNGNQLLEGPGPNYFWLAYDVPITATAGNVLDAQCTSVTVNGTPYAPTVTNPTGSRSIFAQMNGSYTINPTGTGLNNFTSFSAAVNRLIWVGITGPVSFAVSAATYNEQVTIPPIPGASATNTITFDGGTGNRTSRILQYSTPNQNDAVVLFNGADYISFKNITIRATGASYGYGVQFAPGIDQMGSNYNRLITCNIEVPTNTTSSYHIPIVASMLGSYSTSGNNANYTLIQDCNIFSGYFGMSWYGVSSSAYTQCVGNEFLGNNFYDWYYYGTYFYYTGSGFKFKNNRVVQRSSGTYTTSGGYAIYGYYLQDGPEISYNFAKCSYAPIYVPYVNTTYASTANRGKIYNNMAVAIGTSTVYGLYCSYPRYTDIVYNSVLARNTSSTGYGYYLYGASSSYDNKFANNYLQYEGTSTWYPMYNYYSASLSMCDYNAYHKVGTSTDNWYWNYNSSSTSFASFAAMKAGVTGYHQNSITGPPYYISDDNLHSRSHVGWQAGIAWSGITDDYDGETRAAIPCIGADEYPTPPPEYDVAVKKVRLHYADGRWTRREGTATHQVDAVIANTGIFTPPASVTAVYKIGSMPTTSSDGVAQVFSPSWNPAGEAMITFAQPVSGLTAGAPVDVWVRVFWASDQEPSNDAAKDTRIPAIVKVHGEENFNAMTPSAFSDYPGFLDYKWKVENVNGGTSWELRDLVGSGASKALYYPGDGQQANDWIFAPAAELAGGSSYRVDFLIRSESGQPQTVEVAWGTSPDPSSMTTFATFSNFANSGFMAAKDLAGGMDPYFNTPNVNGDYFLGFHVTSAAGAGGVVIDDILLDDNPSPPPKIGIGTPGAAVETFIDNPATKLQFQANYKSPVLVSRSYQVLTKTNIYGSHGDFLWDVETTTPWITLTKPIPEPTAQGYNFTPPRPRQFQTFTMTLNPVGLAPGVHMGSITLYGILFNDEFRPPSHGLIATNEPLVLDVELRIINTGSKSGPAFEEMTLTNLSPGVYNFVGPTTGNPIADVEVTSGFIPSMTIRVYPNQLPPNITRMMYVKRYWQITHTGTAWTANITFPYADQEAAMVLDRYQLRGVRQAVLRGAWENPINGTSSNSDPVASSVKVFDLNETNSGGNIALAQPYFYTKRAELAPEHFALEGNFPNPFSGTTMLSFALAEQRAVSVLVYNTLGMQVAELVNESLPEGRYEVPFDASGLPAGSYLCRMVAGDFTATLRMQVAK